MYAIGYVIIGAPITQEISDVAAARDEELDAEDGGYFTVLYNGGGGPFESGYIGAELACFDECSNFPFSDIDKQIEYLAMEETAKKLSALPDAYRKVLLPIKRWIVWGSS